MFAGEVRYARDAFEGLRLMDALMAVKRGEEGAALPAPRERRVKARTRHAARATEEVPLRPPARSDVAVDIDVPTPPFWGDRIVKGIALADVASYLDERATFMGQWGLKGSRDGAVVRGAGRDRGPAAAARLAGPDPDRRRSRSSPWSTATGPATARATTWSCCDPAARSSDPRGELHRFTFPRQRRPRYLCLADFFRDRELALAQGSGRGRLPPGHHGCGRGQGDGEAVRAATPTGTTWSCTG